MPGPMEDRVRVLLSTVTDADLTLWRTILMAVVCLDDNK